MSNKYFTRRESSNAWIKDEEELSEAPETDLDFRKNHKSILGQKWQTQTGSKIPNSCWLYPKEVAIHAWYECKIKEGVIQLYLGKGKMEKSFSWTWCVLQGLRQLKRSLIK